MEKAGGGITEVREEWILFFDLEAEMKNKITHQSKMDFFVSSQQSVLKGENG
jgi:hypothetical protein